MPQQLPQRATTSKRRFTFPASARLKERKDFLRVREYGKRAYSRHFLVSFVPSNAAVSSGSSRLGIAVTKKVERSAAKRNRVKRCVREFFRMCRPAFVQNVDIVVVARDASGLGRAKDVAEELYAILKSQKLIGDVE